MTDPTPDTHLRSPRNPVTFIGWIIAGLIVWLVVAVLVGVGVGRILRNRGHHYPSPHHPAVRNRRRVCDHGHPGVQRWSDKDVDECWYGHPITTGMATCTCPGSGRERPQKTLHATDGKPLKPHEAAAWKQLKEKLR